MCANLYSIAWCAYSCDSYCFITLLCTCLLSVFVLAVPKAACAVYCQCSGTSNQLEYDSPRIKLAGENCTVVGIIQTTLCKEINFGFGPVQLFYFLVYRSNKFWANFNSQ